MLRLPHPPPLLGVFRPINVHALVATIPRSPCAPAEVSPGNWVGFDCSPLSFVTRAVPFYKPRSFVGAGLPGAVDGRENGMEGPMKNQGAVGTCTAVSLSTAMEHELRRMGIQDPVSALHIWSQYSVPRMGTAGDSNVDKKLAAEAAWPYDPAVACKMMRRSMDSCGAAYGVSSNTADNDPAIKSQKAKADSVGRYKLLGVEKLTSHDPNEVAAIISGGSDVWVAFNINRDAWKSKNMVNHVIQDYSVTQSTGHAVVLAGYRVVNGVKQFLIHNSWGTGWGNQGYAWIGENMVRNQLRYGYRVRVANPAGGTTPPGGNNPPTAKGCPAGQAMDVVYQQCVPACANGAPAAGLCIPGLPQPTQPTQPTQPPPGGNTCPAGQAPDVMSGKCTALCAGGLPAIGGLCLPHIQ